MLHLIPPTAAVSAEEGLVPHLGDRPAAYLFPDLGPRRQAEYVALDVAGDSFPESPSDVHAQAQALLASGRWGVRFAEDGLLLLQRGARRTSLPPAFLSFLDLRQPTMPGIQPGPLAHFGQVLDLLDYRVVYRPLRYLGYPALDVATRWRVRATPPADLHLANSISAGGTVLGTWTDVAATGWYPPSRWRPGQTFWVQMHEAVVPLSFAGVVAVKLTVFTGNPRQAEALHLRLKVTLARPTRGGLGLAEGGTILHLASIEAGS
jgi:hypothetical protein